MPTYEYRCKSCGYEFEEVQSMKADALKICPQCKKPDLKRLFSSGTGLVFKGSGFYLTDYKKANTSSSVSDEKKPAESTTKPEVKPESKPKPTTPSATDSSTK
jgi:putative FmdB family regulatory protein